VEKCLSEAGIPSEAGGASGPMASATVTEDGYISAKEGYITLQTISITVKDASYIWAQTCHIAVEAV
jgi:hypothetical protein